MDDVLYPECIHKQSRIGWQIGPGEGSKILHIECFMQNLTNTFFVDSCKLSKSTQMTIFVDVLTIKKKKCLHLLLKCSVAWVRIAFSHFSSLFELFKPLKNLSVINIDVHTFLLA